MALRARGGPLHVLTNTPWLEGRTPGGKHVRTWQVQHLSSMQKLMRALPLWRYDAVLLNIEVRLLFVICALKKLLPFVRTRVLSLDLILTRPTTRGENLRFLIRRWLLKEVDRVVLYYRDTAELERIYRFPPGRVRYVPFKVNTLERILGMPATDEGFLLACGRSNRDYTTLCDAMRTLPYECRILAPWREVQEHGTSSVLPDRPANVTLVSDDGTPDSWNQWIARCTAVVLPITPGMLSPSGIGTYLVAMALGKPVIITHGPATRGILSEQQAVLVPPRDVGALRVAIRRVMEDEGYRNSVAEQGHRHALSLGGERRLADDVVRELCEMLGLEAGCETTVAEPMLERQEIRLQ